MAMAPAAFAAASASCVAGFDFRKAFRWFAGSRQASMLGEMARSALRRQRIRKSLTLHCVE
jgi:hypothetical protein